MVRASCYDSRGCIVRCGCVLASEEGMKYSERIWYSRSSMASSQSYASRPTVNSDENEVKISAKMCHTYAARDVANLWRPRLEVWLCAPESLFAAQLTLFLKPVASPKLCVSIRSPPRYTTSEPGITSPYPIILSQTDSFILQ